MARVSHEEGWTLDRLSAYCVPGTLQSPTGGRQDGFVLAFNQPESGEEANLYIL